MAFWLLHFIYPGFPSTHLLTYTKRKDEQLEGPGFVPRPEDTYPGMLKTLITTGKHCFNALEQRFSMQPFTLNSHEKCLVVHTYIGQ